LGYVATNINGVNYYKSPTGDNVMTTESNVVTSTSSVELFDTTLATFKQLIEPAIGISGWGFSLANHLTAVAWGNNDYDNYGYSLFDDNVTAENIVAKENGNEGFVVYSADGNSSNIMAKTEAEVFQYKYEHRKHALGEIEYMFKALKDGFVVMTSSTEGGSVSGISGGNGTYHYGDQITLTATPADGYIFSRWNDGNTENPRTITVTGHTTVWANFASLVKLYVAATDASDDTGTGAVDAPFATIAKAFAKIVEQSDSDPDRDYEIIVDGMLLGPQEIEYNNENTLYVNSITLRGKTGNTDGINAGWDGKNTLLVEIGSALTINSDRGTDVNLIIKNLTIKGGYATNGGGIYLQNTIKNLTLSDGTIVTNNYAHSGGGVYVYNQSFTMEGTAKVTNNKALFYGGGVYVYEYPEVTIGGSAEISSNEAQKGGGLYIGAASSYNTIIRENATIKQNTATSEGGGVYVDDYGKLEMQGGAISNNQLQSTEGYGSGVYFKSGLFSVSGSAQIATNNDVYLGGESYPAITIAGALTAGTVARITPNSYSYFGYMYDEELDETHPILKLADEADNTLLIADVCNKFAVTPQFVDETYSYFVIDEDGYLERQHKIGFIYYKGSEPHEVASYLCAAMPAAPAAPTKDGTTGSFMGWYQLHTEWDQNLYQDIVSLVPYNAESEVTGDETFIGVWNETVEVDGQDIKSVADALNYYDHYCAYTINVNGTLNQPQTIGFMGGDMDYNLHSITLQGKTGTNATIDGGWVDGGSTPETTYSALSIYTQVPVTIQNITIKGGYATNGGGINIDNPLANVTIANGADIRDNYATYNGGGVYAKGTLRMIGGSISENSCGGTSTTAGRGGGVSFLDATFVMSGGSIANNEAKALNTTSFGEVGSYGGGVYVSASSTMYMYGTAVIGNQNATSAATADNHSNIADCGGGVYIATNNYGAGRLYLGYNVENDEAVETSLSGGIYYNYASNNTNENMHAAGCGGGVSAQAGNINYCSVSMASGSIAYNGAASDGGGIYLQGQSAYGSGNNVCPMFEMSGGNISSNAAANNGKGVYAGSYSATCYSRFYMQGSAQIAANNDVYLTSQCPIILKGSLTNDNVATITPADYNDGKAVLTYDTELEQANGEGIVSNSSSKFAVTPQEDMSGVGQTTEWTINNDGMLQKTSQIGGANPIGALNGKFSVAADKQVYFSQGNLQYQASTSTWRFADNQYDYVGDASNGNVYENGAKSDNSQISDTYTGWIDLFCWGTGNTPTQYDQWSDYSTFIEWGNKIVGGSWRTLTNDEWQYLISRTGKCSLAQITISGKTYNGLVLLPDNWGGQSLTISNNNYTANKFTEETWTEMQQNGAVFLPAAGGRSYDKSVQNLSTTGNYWSSDNYDGGTNAYYFYFSSDYGTNTNQYNLTYCGYSVRLVQDVESGTNP